MIKKIIITLIMALIVSLLFFSVWKIMTGNKVVEKQVVETMKPDVFIEYVNTVSMIPYKTWRTQDETKIKSFYIDGIKSMYGMTKKDFDETLRSLPQEVSSAYLTNMEFLHRTEINWSVEEKFALNKMISNVPYYSDARDMNVITSTLISYSPVRQAFSEKIENKEQISENVETELFSKAFVNDLPIRKVKWNDGFIKVEFSESFHGGVELDMIPHQSGANILWKCVVHADKSITPDTCEASK